MVASSTRSTTATLQAWNRAPGGGWLPSGGAVYAHVGSAGLTTTPARDVGHPDRKLRVTQASAGANPGTTLPYFVAGPQDWWVSDVSSRFYNTHQICSTACPFDTAAGENLYQAGYVYAYAVVIDYNRFPAQAGAGSAFFLHVTDGGPTAGCVSIPQATLVSLLSWLDPSAHPRILIGVG